MKVPLGLWDGSTENKTVARHLLADLVDRGLDVEQGVLVVLDGGKALRAAVGEVLGPVPVQRCLRHKERNVLDHLPERDRHRSSAACGQPGSSPTTPPPGTASAPWPASSSTRTPAPPPRSGRASTRP